MPKTTTNKSIRFDEPRKAMRRRPVTDGEVDEASRVAGADGKPRRGRKRPGRAASLRTSSNRTRSQRWRAVANGRVKRRPNLAAGRRKSSTDAKSGA